ncbi:MAG: EF-P lysine aminoacylase EpmA [Polyangiaceae bacterium]|jgi:elongation factor P--(R)-beta-lysine ligase
MKLLRERANVLALIRAFFAQRDFLEVETPLLVPSPGLDLHLEAFEVGTRSAARYLITSPEYQMKRLLGDGHSRIFQIAKCFRKGEQGQHHNPEFTMLEWYRANAGVEDVMKDTEELVAMLSSGRVQLGERTIDTRTPVERWTVCEAFERFADIGEDETLDLAANDEERYFQLMVESVEPGLAALDHAVFLVDYPASQASLARKRPDDPRVAERFELYVGGIELCNGFGELIDPVEQRARLDRDRAERTARGLPLYPIDEKFLDALKNVPPSGGNALGVDRLVALVCGGTEIRKVMAFTVEEL